MVHRLIKSKKLLFLFLLTTYTVTIPTQMTTSVVSIAVRALLLLCLHSFIGRCFGISQTLLKFKISLAVGRQLILC